MSKSKFDYGNFWDGYRENEFVCHATKYAKEEAIELFIVENGDRFDKRYYPYDSLRMPTIEDVYQRRVRYYPITPYFVDYDSEGGCYSYCSKNQRGSFPVWVISFESLETGDKNDRS